MKDIKELDKNINEVQHNLLDPNYVSSKRIGGLIKKEKLMHRWD